MPVNQWKEFLKSVHTEQLFTQFYDSTSTCVHSMYLAGAQVTGITDRLEKSSLRK